MKPDWDRLMKGFNKSKKSATAIIGDVDCTAAGKPLCDANGVRGFPTIKYGDPADLQDYEGDRTYKALAKFASKNLGPQCGPKRLDLCSDEKKAEIETFMALPDDEIASRIAAGETKLADAEATFTAATEKLQKTYEDLQKAKDAAVESVQKSANLGVLKQVKAAQAAKK